MLIYIIYKVTQRKKNNTQYKLSIKEKYLIAFIYPPIFFTIPTLYPLKENY